MSTTTASQDLTQAVKTWARNAGAALVGIANIERFDPQPPYYDRAPKGHDPRDFVPNAKSVISIAQPILNPVMDAPAVMMDREVELLPPDIKQRYLELVYHVGGHQIQDHFLEFIAQILGQNLLAQGYEAMIFPTSGIHPAATMSHIGMGGQPLTERQIFEGPSERWAELYSPFKYSPGPFSHRHAATRAGLGEFGYNNVVLTPEFGPRQRFNSIITDAELVPDPLISEPICLRDDCLLCLKACYMNAILFRDDPRTKDYRSVDQIDKACIFVDTPCRSYPQVCNARQTRVPDAPVRGDCVRICPVPRPRTRLPERLQAIVEAWRSEPAQQ